MNEAIVIKLHFTLGNQGDALEGLVKAVSMDCAFVKHVSLNMDERFYLVSVIDSSFKELTEIVKYENIDIDIAEVLLPIKK